MASTSCHLKCKQRAECRAAVDLSLLGSHAPGPGLGESEGSCRQTLLGKNQGCHGGGACAALGHSWISTRNKVIKDLMANHHQNWHHHHPNEPHEWPTHALCQAFTGTHQKNLPPLLILSSYFNPPASVSQPNNLLWSLDYITGSVCKNSTNKFWCCPLFQTSLQ